VPTVARAQHPPQAADGVRDPPVAADDAAHVALAHLQRQRDLVIGFADLDHHGVRVVDE
jgi:hypothetical protein